MASAPLPAAAVRYSRGVYMPTHDLWLDPWDNQPFAFVSHAHADHIGLHREVILSTVTSRLMHARLPDQKRQRTPPRFPPDRRRHPPRPAHHPLPRRAHRRQRAELHRERRREGSLLYTGDFKLRAGLSAEATEWVQADTLIMETTFGLPRFRFPPTPEVLAHVVKFCQEALEENVVPVLFGYSLGKSQEILMALDPGRAARHAPRRGPPHDRGLPRTPA